MTFKVLSCLPFVIGYITILAGFSRVVSKNASAIKLVLAFLGMYILIGVSIMAFFSAVASAAEHSVDPRVHIAIIDTGANIPDGYKHYLCLDYSHLDLTGYGLQDVYRHGTNVTGIIAKRMNPDTQCLQIIKWVHDENDQDRFNRRGLDYANYVYGKALAQALKYHAKYVNMSYGGGDVVVAEVQGIINLLRSGAIITAAAGNNAQNLDNRCDYYPACYNIKSRNFHVVGNQGAGSTDFGNKVTDWANGNAVEGFGVTMTGTSQATAVLMGSLLK